VESAPPSPLAVLLVEDSSDDARIILRHLRRGGYEPRWRRVQTAEGLAGALHEGAPWDVVLSDYRLPRFDVLEALGLVRRHDPDLPFIVVSGAIGEEMAVQVMRAGAHDYIMKDNLSRLLPAIERERREAALRRAKRAYERDLRLADEVFEGSQEGIVVTDAQARILRVNPAFTRITGYLPDEAVGQTPRILRSGRHDRGFSPRLWRRLLEQGHWQGEIWNRRKNGEIYPQWMSISALYDSQGRPSHFVALFTDLSALRDMEARLHHLARFDPLTELPNRTLFQEHCRLRIQAGERFRLYYLGLSGLSRINTSLGHQAGDHVLRLVAQRLRGTVGERGMVTRMGGDEFAFVHADALEEAVAHAFAVPFVVNGKEVYLNPVIGSAAHPRDAATMDTLMKCAHAAFRTAKQGQRTYLPYQRGTYDRLERRLDLDSALRRAFRRRELTLHYQAQWDLNSGQLVGAEVLLRWPAKPHLPVQELVALMEENGLILDVGRWVLEQAHAQHQAWMAAGWVAPPLAVNLSALQFHDPHLLSHLQRLQSEGPWLELEITESCLMEDVHSAQGILARLRALGIRIAVDDFGTGYSSLSYLKRLPLDTLKIDRSFVTDLEDKADDRAIVGAILGLGRSLGLCTLAEGVETAAQAQWLKAQGCRLAQGHLLGAPLPADRFAQRHLERLPRHEAVDDAPF